MSSSVIGQLFNVWLCLSMQVHTLAFAVRFQVRRKDVVQAAKEVEVHPQSPSPISHPITTASHPRASESRTRTFPLKRLQGTLWNRNWFLPHENARGAYLKPTCF